MGLQDSMLSILIIAFLLAGILSKLLRLSGLIEALVYLTSVFKLGSGIYPGGLFHHMCADFNSMRNFVGGNCCSAPGDASY